MTVVQLIAALRDLLDDENQPYKWADSALIRYLNEGEEQACRRAYLLYDGNTASICQVSVSASVASYLLHSKILQVKRLVTASSTIPLTQMTREELDDKDVAWISTTGPGEMFVHEANNEIIIVPIPQNSVNASIIAARLPLASFSNGTTEVPEILPQYHNDLLLWAMSKSYEKRDADTQNIDLSKFYETRFEARFGPLPSAKTERLKRILDKKSLKDLAAQADTLMKELASRQRQGQG